MRKQAERPTRIGASRVEGQPRDSLGRKKDLIGNNLFVVFAAVPYNFMKRKK